MGRQDARGGHTKVYQATNDTGHKKELAGKFAAQRSTGEDIAQHHAGKGKNNPPGPFDSDFLRLHSNQFQKYQSRLHVLDAIGELDSARKSALSVLLAKLEANKTVRIFAVVHDFRTVIEIMGPLQNEEEHTTSRSKFGLNYYCFESNSQPLDWVDDVGSEFQDPDNFTVGYGVLLPLLETEAVEENRLFALMSSSWKVLSEGTTLEQLF